MKKLTKLASHPAAPGVLLIAAMIAALVTANTATNWYGSLLGTTAVVGIDDWEIEKPLLLWINDGLMAVFFFLVGLELKREVLFGELADRRKAVLPLLGALGGVVVPSSIYAAVNWGDPVALSGWAIPAATDIAFALGILAILGSRVPVALKVLLASIAVIDDLAAIVIIALFYTDQLSTVSFVAAGIAIVFLTALNRSGVRSPAPYVLVGIALWVAVLKSGVHATLAGVVLAAAIPAGRDASDKSTLAYRFQHGLHPWVGFLVLPAFAFANAGVPLAGLSLDSLLASVPLGIALGLFVGKQLGVFGCCWLAVKCGLAKLPVGVGWRQVYGMSLLCGIGFTMSLFIGSLAFETAGGPNYAIDDRIGILAGSFLSAFVGIFVLSMKTERAREPEASCTHGKLRVQDSGVVNEAST